MPTPKDYDWMARALLLAEQAEKLGEVPVGALVVCGDRIIGEGYNQPITGRDPTAHAEIMALRKAATAIANYRLPECDLYVTLEPCTMCVGAMVHARIRRVIYAASEPRAGVVQSRGKLLDADYLNHRVQWHGGVLAQESAELLQRFFQARRAARRAGDGGTDAGNT